MYKHEEKVSGAISEQEGTGTIKLDGNSNIINGGVEGTGISNHEEEGSGG